MRLRLREDFLRRGRVFFFLSEICVCDIKRVKLIIFFDIALSVKTKKKLSALLFHNKPNAKRYVRRIHTKKEQAEPVARHRGHFPYYTFDYMAHGSRPYR